jgi:hypothetical protein
MGKRPCQLEQPCKQAVGGGMQHCKARGGGRRCQHEGCTKGAEGGTGYCVTHRGGRRCQEAGCTKSAQGGKPHCSAHGGGRRFQQQGCSKSVARAPGSVYCTLCLRRTQPQPDLALCPIYLIPSSGNDSSDRILYASAAGVGSVAGGGVGWSATTSRSAMGSTVTLSGSRSPAVCSPLAASALGTRPYPALIIILRLLAARSAMNAFSCASVSASGELRYAFTAMPSRDPTAEDGTNGFASLRMSSRVLGDSYGSDDARNNPCPTAHTPVTSQRTGQGWR